MRSAILLVALMGCADEPDRPDLHALGPCHPALGYSAAAKCEFACSNVMPSTGTGCPAARHPMHFLNNALACDDTFQFEGVTGCCLKVDTPDEAWFFVCDD